MPGRVDVSHKRRFMRQNDLGLFVWRLATCVPSGYLLRDS